MKQLLKEHKGLIYRFTFYERSRVVMIEKDIVLTQGREMPDYTIEWATSFWRCSCPGAKYHGTCWHVEIIGELKSMPSINTPEADWDEEFVEERIDDLRARNRSRPSERRTYA